MPQILNTVSLVIPVARLVVVGLHGIVLPAILQQVQNELLLYPLVLVIQLVGTTMVMVIVCHVMLHVDNALDLRLIIVLNVQITEIQERMVLVFAGMDGGAMMVISPAKIVIIHVPPAQLETEPISVQVAPTIRTDSITLEPMAHVHVRMVSMMMAGPGVPPAPINAIPAILQGHVLHVIRMERDVTTISLPVPVKQDIMNRVIKVIVKLATGGALHVLEQGITNANRAIVLLNTDGLMQLKMNVFVKMAIMTMDLMYAKNVIILVSPALVLNRPIVDLAILV